MISGAPYSKGTAHETMCEIENSAGNVVCVVQGCGQIKLPNRPETQEMADLIVAALNSYEARPAIERRLDKLEIRLKYLERWQDRQATADMEATERQ